MPAVDVSCVLELTNSGKRDRLNLSERGGSTVSLWLDDVMERKKKDETYRGPGFVAYARLIQSVLATRGVKVSLAKAREVQRSLCAVHETLLANGMDVDFGCVVVHPFVKRVASNLTSLSEEQRKKNMTVTTTSKPSKRLRRRFNGSITDKDRAVLNTLYQGCGTYDR